MQNYLDCILEGFRGSVLFNEPMKRYTSFRIGGPADVILYPEDEGELSNIVRLICLRKIPLFVMGGGSNLLISDKGVRGITLSLFSKRAGKCFRRIEKIREDKTGIYVYAGAGVAIKNLLRYTIDEGLSGLEFAAGIPGSLGGAIFMNAGSYGSDMRQIIESVRIVDRWGNIFNIAKKNITFTYRASHIPGVVIVGAVLRFHKGYKRKIQEETEKNLSRKKETQPLRACSAGSIFKNPDRLKAWELIESVGLRGASTGGASISEKHANFILNNGSATCQDVLSLIRLAGSKIERETGLTMELEIKIVGKV